MIPDIKVVNSRSLLGVIKNRIMTAYDCEVYESEVDYFLKISPSTRIALYGFPEFTVQITRDIVVYANGYEPFRKDFDGWIFWFLGLKWKTAQSILQSYREGNRVTSIKRLYIYREFDLDPEGKNTNDIANSILSFLCLV